MKKLCLFLLLASSTNLFAMKKVSERDFAKLSGVAKTLDELSLKFLKVLRRRANVVGGGSDRFWEAFYLREDEVIRDFADKAREFEELQLNIFNKLICKPKIGLTGKEYFYTHNDNAIRELEENVPSSIVNGKSMKSEMCIQGIKKVLEDVDRQIKEELEHWDRHV